MPKVYVAGALIPTGGAYMAYHLGRLLHVHFGYELVDVTVSRVEGKVFQYDTPIRTVSIAELESSIREDDLLVVNPSFSHFFFGLRLPGRKIMYVQDFRTFSILDCHFDLYVAVSSVVQNFLAGVYGIKAPIIPAFIQLGRLPASKPWRERPAGSSLVYMKYATPEHKMALEHLQKSLKKKSPVIELTHIVQGRGMSHGDFMQAIGSVRYFVNLSLAEGFGLVALEAMGMGAMVTGLDGLAGRDYMRSGENCLVGSVKDLRLLPDIVHQAFTDEALAERCADASKKTAQAYGRSAFKTAWLAQLSQFLRMEPANV